MKIHGHCHCIYAYVGVSFPRRRLILASLYGPQGHTPAPHDQEIESIASAGPRERAL